MLYLMLQAIICVAVALLAGWLTMQLDVKSDNNEFRGMYMLIAGYTAPVIFMLSLPAYLYAWFRLPVSRRRRFGFMTATIVTLLVNIILFAISR